MPKIRVGHITVAVSGAYAMNAVLIAGTDGLLSSMLGNANSQLFLVIEETKKMSAGMVFKRLKSERSNP